MVGAKGCLGLSLTVLLLSGCEAIVLANPDGDGGADGGGGGSLVGGATTSSAGGGDGGGLPSDDFDGYSACYAACDADPCIANEELCAEYCFEDIFPGCGPESLEYHRCANAYCDPDSDPDEECVAEYDALRDCKTNLVCNPVECAVTDGDCACSNDCEAGHTRRSECFPVDDVISYPYCNCFLDDEAWSTCLVSELVCSEHSCCADYW